MCVCACVRVYMCVCMCVWWGGGTRVSCCRVQGLGAANLKDGKVYVCVCCDGSDEEQSIYVVCVMGWESYASDGPSGGSLILDTNLSQKAKTPHFQ